jgi:hypothetical protein
LARSLLVSTALAIAALAPQGVRAQTPAPLAPSVYIQQAVLSTVSSDQGRNRRPGRACTITALMRQYCGTAASCDVGSRSVAGQPSFFVWRQNDIAQICDLPLSQVTDLRISYRCRYGDRVDGTVIEESRSIALENTGDPLGRSAFRILMACH